MSNVRIQEANPENPFLKKRMSYLNWSFLNRNCGHLSRGSVLCLSKQTARGTVMHGSTCKWESLPPPAASQPERVWLGRLILFLSESKRRFGESGPDPVNTIMATILQRVVFRTQTCPLRRSPPATFLYSGWLFPNQTGAVTIRLKAGARKEQREERVERGNVPETTLEPRDFRVASIEKSTLWQVCVLNSFCLQKSRGKKWTNVRA